MRVDPAVTRRKFDIEVQRVRNQEVLLRGWGCWLARVEYPQVDAVFVPRHPMCLTIPVVPPPSMIAVPGQPKPVLATMELPMLAGRAFGTRIDFADFDQRPLSVAFCDPWTWQSLVFETMFRATHVGDQGQVFNVLLGNHPATGRPFLCMRGVREYHEHPQHTGDDWMLYRGSVGLFAVLATIWRTCVVGNRPNVIVHPAKQLEVRWERGQEN